MSATFLRPDISPRRFLPRSSWLEFYTLQSQAIQNAYSDFNGDVASGALPCPVAACPLRPIIHGSAFSQTSFVGQSTAATATYGTVTPYSATYPDDFYSYYGNMTVWNEHTSFPPWPSTPQSSALQNLNVRRAALRLVSEACLKFISAKASTVCRG